MKCYVLNYEGVGEKPKADVERLRALPETIVLNDKLPRMIVVESTQSALLTFFHENRGWSIAPDVTYHNPEPVRLPGDFLDF